MNQKGFTLIELLAVIVILAIILSIAVPRITSLIDNSKKSSFESNAKMVLNAIRIKVLENSNFDLTTLNKNTLETILNIDSDNYSQVFVRNDNNGKLYITLKGAGQWDNLTASGSLDNISINTTEQIVADGLVSYLEGSNLSSYNGTGTTWYDISGNNNNATLYNGLGYNSSNGGSLVCDGVNDYADISLPLINSYTTITVEGFIKWNTSNNGMFFGMDRYDIYTHNGHLGYNNANGNLIGIPSANVSTLGLIGNYKHYTFVMNKTGLLSTNKIYINGVLQTLLTNVGADGSIPGFISPLRLCSWPTNSNYYANIYYGNLRIYNKELSNAEIIQNFNAQKLKYGL